MSEISAQPVIQCAITGCENAPYADCRWGGDGSQSATFCKAHVDELWEKMNPLVKAAKGHFSIGDVGTFTERS